MHQDIMAKRNQKPEVRKAQREQAVRAAKDQKKATVKKPAVKVRNSFLLNDVASCGMSCPNLAMILTIGIHRWFQCFHICYSNLKDSLTPRLSMGGV